ncbi:hypothetical protein EAH89_18450 [Roseomonas nepalensis]|uniref:Uncharacterized protein n=1 Tax=Muricoccus nepalensis TaxID=1854500 RepID=A0A502FS07_9PROT|nr:hypothetical protein [Roseomonas nepalensis]TPG52367.1 hypothetical protein EAH89_18450 [Roseomonas nepalensis]
MTNPWNRAHGRRAVALGGAALLSLGSTGGATAQGAAPAGRGGAPRCAAGMITKITLEGNGAAAGAVVVFGQVFRPGDVPARTGVLARAGEQAVPTQLDVVARHEDGSVRFGLVSVALPRALSPRQTLELQLHAGDPPAGARPLDPAAVLGNRPLILEIQPVAGSPWRADLRALLAATPRSGATVWQSGPLVTELRLRQNVPAAATGCTSLRLVADLSARADGTTWLDLWLRNDIAMQEGGGDAIYTARLLLDGRELLNTAPLRHFHYTAFGRISAFGPGGAPAPVPAFVRHDLSYLADTGAVARYDPSLTVSEGTLARYGQTVANPAWSTPFNNRKVHQYMPEVGGRDDIGPATQSQAAWLISGDRRAAVYAMGQAEAAGVIPWHHWDPQGAEGGSWLDTRRWPRLWTDPRGGRPPGGLMQRVPEATGWTPESAHQPDLSFVPFILTGRRAFLDHLQSQAAWNVMCTWPDPRGGADANMVRFNQTRGTAWAIRQLHEAAWIGPDGDPQRPYFQRCEANNWAYLRSQIPTWRQAQGEAFGWVPSDIDPPFEVKPWAQDYLVSTAAAAARKGNADARAVLEFMSNFSVGRFLAGDRGFNPRDGAAYVLAATDARRTPLRSWAEIGAQTKARGWSNENGWSHSAGNYSQLALVSLACIADVLDSAEARRAFRWLSSSGAPYTTIGDYAVDPLYRVVPRGAERRSC